jgi:outer membrane lipoprotein carrier protein
MKLMLRAIFAFFLLIPLLAKADAASDQLIQLLDSIHSLQAHFVQTVQDTNNNQLQETIGQMSLQRPGKFRWQVQSPSKQLLIADGNKVWFYDMDLAQITVQKQQNTSKNSPAMLLSSSTESLAQDFSITQLPSPMTGKIFQLMPKIKSDLFKSINLDFFKDQLSSMQMVDNFGQTTTINFDQVKTNLKLNQSLFHFAPPKGVDVIQS